MFQFPAGPIAKSDMPPDAVKPVKSGASGGKGDADAARGEFREILTRLGGGGDEAGERPVPGDAGGGGPVHVIPGQDGHDPVSGENEVARDADPPAEKGVGLGDHLPGPVTESAGEKGSAYAGDGSPKELAGAQPGDGGVLHSRPGEPGAARRGESGRGLVLEPVRASHAGESTPLVSEPSGIVRPKESSRPGMVPVVSGTGSDGTSLLPARSGQADSLSAAVPGSGRATADNAQQPRQTPSPAASVTGDRAEALSRPAGRALAGAIPDMVPPASGAPSARDIADLASLPDRPAPASPRTNVPAAPAGDHADREAPAAARAQPDQALRTGVPDTARSVSMPDTPDQRIARPMPEAPGRPLPPGLAPSPARMTSGARSDLLADLRSFAADLPGAPDMRGHADALQIVRPGQAATVMHGPPPGEMARTALQQIATAIQGNGERSFELLLNPAELGKVRISLSPGDGGMTVSIVADRPESLDLLRRHAGLLADELRDIGYDDTAFSFGAESFGSGSRDGRPGAVPGGPDATQASTDLPEEAASAGDPDEPATRREPLPGRMDIRI